MKITIRLYVRTDRANSKGESPIRLKASFNNQFIWQETGLAVNPEQWDPETERYRTGNAAKNPTKVHPKAAIYNQVLDRKESIVTNTAMNLYLQELAKGNNFYKLTKEELESALQPAAAAPEDQQATEHAAPTPQQIYDNWKAENSHLSPHYLRGPKQVITHLENYAQHLKVPYITPKMIDKVFVNNYFNWLLAQGAKKKTGRRIRGDNALPQHIKFLKTMLRSQGMDATWLKNNYSYETEIITLTWPELQQLLNWQAPSDRWADFRDSVLFVAFSGPRHSDFIKLNASHVRQQKVNLQEVSILHYTQNKTHNKAFMLINQILLTILERNRGRWGGLVKTYSNQVMNRDLKTLMKMVGINTPTSQIRKVKRQLVQLPAQPKYALVTCHTLRKTAATMLLEGGADLLTVRDALGWKSLETVLRYAKNSDTRLLTETQKAWEKLEQDNTKPAPPPEA